MDPTTMIPQSQNHPLYGAAEMPAGTDMIGAFADLGGTLGALGFASWLVVFLLRQHDTERQEMRKAFTAERSRVQEEREKERHEFAEERKVHLEKDSDNDAAMRQSLEKSQEQLLSVVAANQQQMKELGDIMKQHSTDLKALMLEIKMAIHNSFEKIEDKWDGHDRRGNEERRTSSRSRSKQA